MGRKYYVLISLYLISLPLFAQVDSGRTNRPPLRISGVVITSDSITALPSTSIFVNQLPQGTISDSAGFFSLDVYPSDTLIFSAVGYKTVRFVVPDQLIGQQYSLVQTMVRDTIILDEVTIYSLPTTSEFMESFSDESLEFKKSVKTMRTELQEVLKEDIILSKYQPVDVNDGMSRMYSAHWGLVPPNNFLNPLRWSQFVQDLQEKRKRNRKK